jgi:hypothetical protein
MKNKLLLLLFVVSVLGACKKDNKDAPSSVLSGRVIVSSTKQPVGVATNGTQLELWQSGYQLFQKIAVHIDQDGKFSSKLFDGTYKLVRLGGAPWANNTDTITVNLKGSATIDVPVDPFFTATGETFTFNKADTSITGVFTVTRYDATKTSDKVSLHIGLTQFTDANNQIPVTASMNDITPPANYLTAPVTIKVYLNPARHSNATAKQELTKALQKGYVFVRGAVKTNGITQRFYTPVKEISLK